MTNSRLQITSFKIDDDSFLIIGLDDLLLYEIPIPQLDMIDSERPSQFCSYWIDQLSRKTWMDKDSLYKVALEIQKICPSNIINWVRTFTPIERLSYIEAIGKIEIPHLYSKAKQGTARKVRGMTPEELHWKIDLLSERDVMKSIEQGVIKRLEAIGLNLK